MSTLWLSANDPDDSSFGRTETFHIQLKDAQGRANG